MKISLIYPSRGRPDKSFQTYKEWVAKSGCDEIEVILSLDVDDPLLETYKILYDETDVNVIVNQNKSVVEATNRAAEISTGGILIYLSDDFICPENWAVSILSLMPDEMMLIKVDDCLQKFEAPVLTIPIMNRELYHHLGYFWHPDYLSMHVDVDLFHTLKKINAIKLCPQLKFPHEHPSNGKAATDETYRRSAANWNQGLKVLERRKATNFAV